MKHWDKLLGKVSKEQIQSIPMEKIRRNPYQPRKSFDEDELIKLAQSIRSFGLIQPIVVRKGEDGYQIIAGERRYRACCMLGMENIAAIVQDMDDRNAAAVSLIENIQRKELNYFEEAGAYSMLIENFDMTQEELARKVGKSQSAIANKLRLLKLSLAVQESIHPEIVTERHARALLKLSSNDMQMEVVKRIYENQLTVKETEELVEKLSKNNLPADKNTATSGQNVSMIIRDARIFINTIRETIRRARQTGVELVMEEKEDDEEYRIVIRIAKRRKVVPGRLG